MHTTAVSTWSHVGVWMNSHMPHRNGRRETLRNQKATAPSGILEAPIKQPHQHKKKKQKTPKNTQKYVTTNWRQSFYFRGRWLFLVNVLPYCVKCGAPLKETDRFCPVCGTATAKVTREEYTVSGSNLVDRVRELLHEGNVTRIIVKDEAGKTLLEIPVTVGVVGVVLAPWLAALGVVAALVANCKIVVERRE